MGIFKLIFQSLIHYRKAHVTVLLGVAVSAMVLTGTLIVGDSVKYSLVRTAELRLGNIGYAFLTTDRYFRSELAKEVGENINVAVSAMMQLKGIASSQGGKLRMNNIDVHGIDNGFRDLTPGQGFQELPGRNEAYISRNLADRLQLKINDSFVLRVEKVSLIPKNAPFISDEEEQISMRLTVTRILDQEDLGRFNLKASQTAPYNIFISLDFLNDRMGTSGKANRLLIADDPQVKEEMIRSAIEKRWTIADAGIKINSVMDGKEWSVESDRVFLDSIFMESVKKIVNDPSYLLTYLANSIDKGTHSTPYSFVTAGPFYYKDHPLEDNEMIVNEWLATDLGLRVRDSVLLSYFIIGPLRRLKEESTWFHVKGIVPMSGIYGDRTLMPELPGLSDAGSCRSWETGIPIDLDKIRDKDEDYWNTWKGTPKAFIAFSTGKSLWGNRFGDCTAVRFSSKKINKENLTAELQKILDPDKMGFRLQAVKNEGLKAAHGGVDFAELFFGMSFFLLIAGLTLIALLFNIHLERRMPQIGTLKAIGYPNRLVRRLVLYEALVIAVLGVLLGSLLSIWYNKLIFLALNTVWSDIVRTSVLTENIQLTSVITGMGISLLLVYATILYNVYRKLRVQPVKLQRGVSRQSRNKAGVWIKWAAWVSGIMAAGLLFREIALAERLNAEIFFMAGGLLLLSSMFFYANFLYKDKSSQYDKLTFAHLATRNLQRNKARSIRIVLLFALGTFVIVSTGLNQKDPYSDAGNESSGTGGYVFYAETTMPVLKDLNDPETRIEYGLKSPLEFIQMRKVEGDDASCLNLNHISNPRILGIPSYDLQDRFTFVKTSDEFDPDKGWASLRKELPGGVVPAVADQTVIQWGLGKKVGDTLVYRDEFGKEMYVKLVGGLANSIFQGNILIDENNFLKHFPSNSGVHVFLIQTEGKDLESQGEELQRSFRNAGLELTYTADRLAEFNTVENTYLSIFLLLGGLGMILGTIGLGLSLVRNILDRQQELAILRAVGFRKSSILNMLAREHIILLGIGTLIGAISAFVATVPSIFSEFVDASWQTALIIIGLIFLNGLVWIYFIAKGNLRTNLVASLRQE